MGLFERKAEMSVQEWCEHFYSNYVFAPPIGGTDPWQVFCRSTRGQIAQADPSFSEVDDVALSDQLLALRLEVITIAWILRAKESLSPKQSEYTRVYLLNHNQERFWEMMQPYNQAVAKAIVGGSDSSTRTGRTHIASVNSMRAQMFEKWIAMVADPKDAARPANRIGSDAPRKSHRTHVYLPFALTDQVQCVVS
jgi:hypothetical protein